MSKNNNNTPRLRFPEFTGEWVEKKLGDIGDTYNGLTGKSKEDFDNGNAKFITFLNVLKNVVVDTNILGIVNVKDGEKQNRVQCGDMLFNTSSETPEEVGFCSVFSSDTEVPVYLNSFCFGYRYKDKSKYIPLFLAYYLRSSCGRQLMHKLAQGITRFNLSKEYFNKAVVYYPSPEEQKKIADCLSEMDNLISVQSQKVELLKDQKKGMMQQLFPQKGETTPRLRFPEFMGEWVEKKLSEITERVSVGLATSVTPYYRDKGVVMFRNLNIKPDFLDDSDILYLDETFANANPAKKIHTDDVLTVHTGYVGISCVVPPKYDGALTFTTLVTTTKKADLNPRFLSSFLNSNEGAQRITVLQAGCGRNNLNVNDFILLQVPLPPTIGEQQKIADCLSELDTLIASETKQLEALKDHKKGLMQQLFPQPAK